MPSATATNPALSNTLYGSYGDYETTQGGARGQAAPARAQQAQTPQGQPSAAMQAFGGQSGFEPQAAQSFARGFAQGFAQAGAQAAVGTGAPAGGPQGLGAPAAGGAQAGGATPQLMQALQGLVTALTQVVQQLGELIKSMGGAQGAAGNAGTGGNAGAAGNAGGGGQNAGAAGNGGAAGGAYGGGGAAGNAGNAGTGAGNANAGAAGNAGGGYGTGGSGDGAVVGGGQAAQGINPNMRYQDLSTQERTQMSGMTPDQRAALHIWGIQMGSAGKQDGGVYMNVLQNPQNFQPAEVALVQKLAAQEMQMFGGYTGKLLDQEFFKVYQGLTGQDISQRYGNAPINFAQGPVNMDNRQTGQNGLSNLDNELLQLWGHSPLLTGGKIDGSILDYSMNSPHAMEANLNKGDLAALKQMDLASDGVLNGDSLEKGFLATLDRVYLGGPGASLEGGMNAALQEAAARREGLLPPPAPEAQGISQKSLDAMNNAIQNGAKPSSCPFLSGGGGVQGA